MPHVIEMVRPAEGRIIVQVRGDDPAGADRVEGVMRRLRLRPIASRRTGGRWWISRGSYPRLRRELLTYWWCEAVICTERFLVTQRCTDACQGADPANAPLCVCCCFGDRHGEARHDNVVARDPRTGVGLIVISEDRGVRVTEHRPIRATSTHPAPVAAPRPQERASAPPVATGRVGFVAKTFTWPKAPAGFGAAPSARPAFRTCPGCGSRSHRVERLCRRCRS